MKKRNNHKEMLEERQARLLKFVLKQNDCKNLDEAKILANTDQTFRIRMEEAGVKFNL